VDGELTAIPSSTVENAGCDDSNILTPGRYRDLFDKVFPSYLAMGMTYDEFYRQDHTLAIAYRIAFKRKRDRDNENFWLQGAYVYEAIMRVAPLLIPFNEHPKPMPYLDKPYDLGTSEEQAGNTKQKAVADKGLAYMQAQMIKFNKKFGKE